MHHVRGTEDTHNPQSTSEHATQGQLGTWSVRSLIWALEGSFSSPLLLMRDTLFPPEPPGGAAASLPEGRLVSWFLETPAVLGVLGAFPVAEDRLDSLSNTPGSGVFFSPPLLSLFSCRGTRCAGGVSGGRGSPR